MKPCFADAYYFFALMNKQDVAHAEALRLSRDLRRPPIRGPELGTRGVYTGIWHFHIGDLHIPCSPTFAP